MPSDPTPTPSPRRRRALGWGVGALLLVVALSAGWLLRERDAGPAPAPPPSGYTVYTPSGEAVPGLVYVDSRPAGAEVRLGGERLGATPLILQRTLDGPTARVTVAHPDLPVWEGEVPVVGGGLRLEVDLSDRAP